MFSTNFDKNAKLWSGPDVLVPYDLNVSIAQVLLEKMKLNGSRIAQISIESGNSFTYDQLRKETIQAAKNLQKRGYGSKQVFTFIAKNSDHLTSLVFASFCLGCLADMINTTHEKDAIVRMLQMTKPTVVFCDIDQYDVVDKCLKEAQQQAKVFTINGLKRESEPIENLFFETGTEDQFIPVEVDGFNDAAIKMGSSGTTGPSKGILLSHAACIFNLVATDCIKTDDVLLSMNSIDWITSLMVNLMATFNGAARVITTHLFSPEFQLDVIEKYKITFLITPPFHMVSLLKSGLMSKEKLQSIRMQIVGGARVPFNAFNEYNAYLVNGSAVTAYGLSEMAGFVSLDWPRCGKDTVGKLASGFSIKIIDDSGERCDIGMDGEIYVKSPRKFIGYCGNDKLTKDALDDEGFFATGDIGHVDNDGHIFIVDREKDLLKYCSRKFSPSEVESFLICSPEIDAACVTGIPDDLAGDLPAAIIVRKPDAKITQEEVFQLVADRFPDNYQCRGGVYFVDEIPKTITGKLLRRKAKEIAIALFKRTGSK